MLTELAETAPCWAGTETRIGAAALPDRETFDIVIIGAGLTGCSTALHLATLRPGLRVALLDAVGVAAGASGRGTGLLGPRLGPPVDIARRHDGDSAARARFLRSQAAVSRVIDLARRYAPAAVSPCSGQLVVGVTRAEQAAVHRRATGYAALGLPVALVRAGDHALPAAPERPALHYPFAAGVDPARLTRGLARAAADAGVVVVEHCPVTGLSRQGEITRVLAGPGRVDARAVVVTVDVTGPGLNVRLGDQLELQVCASATEPLADELLESLGGPDGPHVLSAAALGAYRRITPDGRLIFGGGPVAVTAGHGPERLLAAARRAWRWQRAWLISTHPRLAAVQIQHRWRGRVSMTRDGLPVLARTPGPGEIWYAGGWNGHGLAATVEAGALLASRVLSDADQTRDDAFGTGVPWLLARSAARPLVRAYLAVGSPKLGPRPREGRSSAAAYT